MLWTVFVVLLVLWLVGMVSSYTLGGFIHVLLVVARRGPPDQHHTGTKSGMRLGTLVGIVLIILGVVGLAMGGFSFTHKEKVVDLGPIHATADKKESVPIPPLLGAIAVVGGVLLVAATSRRRS